MPSSLKQRGKWTKMMSKLPYTAQVRERHDRTTVLAHRRRLRAVRERPVLGVRPYGTAKLRHGLHHHRRGLLEVVKDWIVEGVPVCDPVVPLDNVAHVAVDEPGGLGSLLVQLEPEGRRIVPQGT